MADVNEVEATGPLDKLKRSVGGMVVGVLLLPTAFVVLAVGACGDQASDKLQGAMPADQAAAAAKAGKAVYVTGKIQAEPIGDPEFVRPGNFLSLERTGEIYAWVQKTEAQTEKQGKSDAKAAPRYYCKLEWTSAKPNVTVGEEKGCEGKFNKPRTIQDKSFRASPAITAGGKVYSINQDQVEYAGLPGGDIKASELITPLTGSAGYYYPDNPSCASSPSMGCERVRFAAISYIPQIDHTVVGQLDGTTFSVYAGKYLKLGPGDYKTTMKSVASEDSVKTLVLFIISIVLFWLGLDFLSGPILKLIEFIPVIGGMGAGAIRFFFAIVSVVVMGITYLFLKYLLFIAISVGVVGVILVVLKKLRAKPAAA